jgi:hypothetical protein
MDQKMSILTRILHHCSRGCWDGWEGWEGWEENSNFLAYSMSGPPGRSEEDCSAAGEWSGGNRSSLSDKTR